MTDKQLKQAQALATMNDMVGIRRKLRSYRGAPGGQRLANLLIERSNTLMKALGEFVLEEDDI